MTDTATRTLNPFNTAFELLERQAERENSLFLCAANRAALSAVRWQTERALEMDQADGGSDAALPTVANYVATLDALDPVGADELRATLRRQFNVRLPERAL